jgi:hypothetical protein
MDKKFILSSKRFSNSPEIDYFQTIELNSSFKKILNDDNITNIDLSELFNIERDKSNKYRLIGKIDYLSILNNLNQNYNKLSDFFIRYDNTIGNKNIFNSFKIYLVAKSNAYTAYDNNIFKERYEIIGELNDIQLYNCGFSRNIFYEQNYLYNFNIDVDVENKKDYFNKPITEVFLYFDYQLNTTKNEILLKKDFNNLSNENNNITITETTNTTYNLNDLLIGNLIKRDDNEFDETVVNEQMHKIRLIYGNNEIVFKYNPFIKITLREYNDTVYFGNINTNTKNILKIPDYAKPVGDINSGNIIWKELLPHGFIDPISNIGVNFPFINGRHYVYTNNVFAIQPDLSNYNTNVVFEKINLQGYNRDLFILENPDKEIC